MSKKTLLSEAQVRRWMSLANIEPVQQLKTLSETYPGARDEEMDMGEDPDMDMGPPEGEDMMDDEMPDEEGAGSEQLSPEAVEALEVAAEAAADAMLDALRPYGVEGDASREGEGEDEMEEPAADDAPMDDMPQDPEGGDEDMEMMEGIELIDDEELVEQVMVRVASRLRTEQKRRARAKKIDQVAERIARKISKLG